MSKRYAVIFHYLLKPREIFMKKMSKLGVPADMAERIINKAPVILREDDSLEYSKKYAAAVFDAGGWVDIRLIRSGEGHAAGIAIEPLKNFILCPRCGLKQIKKDVCEKCGTPLQENNQSPETG